MSWFYEALQRAERESLKPRKTKREDLAGLNGEPFLVEIEELSSLSVKLPSEAAEEQAGVATVTEGTPKTTEIPVQSADAPAVVPAEAWPSRNGYRHLELPLQRDPRLVFHTDCHGLAAEQFRLLRRKLTQEFSNGGVLMVTSPTQGDGKTLTSINLCSCLAEAGEPTLLIEADMRRPTVAKVLSCPLETPAMEDVLTGEAQPPEAIYRIEQLRFCAVMLASVPRDPSKLINGSRFRELLGWARGQFRWTILDTSPVLPTADVADLMPQVDGTLLVIRAESTPRELSKRAFEMLGKRLHGVILNGATIDSNPDYRYLRGH